MQICKKYAKTGAISPLNALGLGQPSSVVLICIVFQQLHSTQVHKIIFMQNAARQTFTMGLHSVVQDLLKGPFHPAFLARVVSWLAFVVAIFMGHENGGNKGQPRDDACKECWMKEIL